MNENIPVVTASLFVLLFHTLIIVLIIEAPIGAAVVTSWLIIQHKIANKNYSRKLVVRLLQITTDSLLNHLELALRCVSCLLCFSFYRCSANCITASNIPCNMDAIPMHLLLWIFKQDVKCLLVTEPVSPLSPWESPV